MTKVFFNQNIVSPYRLPLFEELNEEYDVTVWFHRENSKKRKWKTEQEKYSFDSQILKNIQLGPITLNPGFLWKLLRKDFDIYFINENPSTFLSSFAILLVAKLKRKPAVIWSETIDTEKSKELPNSITKKVPVKAWRGFKEIYRKILFKFSNRFVAFSEMAEEFLIERGVSQDKIEKQIQVMPENLLPSPENHDLKEKYHENKVILSLGYLEERKGVQDLIEAFKQIEDDDYRLIIAGTGNYEQKLKKKASTDERIKFLGYLTEQEKANYFDKSDLFVLPTHHDPWGLVINEAIHYGTPVITTVAAGAKQLLNQENIYNPGDVEQLNTLLKKQFPKQESGKAADIRSGIKAIKRTIEEFN